MKEKTGIPKEEKTIFIILAIILVVAIGIIITWYFTKDRYEGDENEPNTPTINEPEENKDKDKDEEETPKKPTTNGNTNVDNKDDNEVVIPEPLPNPEPTPDPTPIEPNVFEFDFTSYLEGGKVGEIIPLPTIQANSQLYTNLTRKLLYRAIDTEDFILITTFMNEDDSFAPNQTGEYKLVYDVTYEDVVYSKEMIFQMSANPISIAVGDVYTDAYGSSSMNEVGTNLEVLEQNTFALHFNGWAKPADIEFVAGWGFGTDTHVLPIIITLPESTNWNEVFLNGSATPVTPDVYKEKPCIVYLLGLNEADGGAAMNALTLRIGVGEAAVTYSYEFDYQNVILYQNTTDIVGGDSSFVKDSEDNPIDNIPDSKNVTVTILKEETTEDGITPVKVNLAGDVDAATDAILTAWGFENDSHVVTLAFTLPETISELKVNGVDATAEKYDGTNAVIYLLGLSMDPENNTESPESKLTISYKLGIGLEAKTITMEYTFLVDDLVLNANETI